MLNRQHIQKQIKSVQSIIIPQNISSLILVLSLFKLLLQKEVADIMKSNINLPFFSNRKIIECRHLYSMIAIATYTIASVCIQLNILLQRQKVIPYLNMYNCTNLKLLIFVEVGGIKINSGFIAL